MDGIALLGEQRLLGGPLPMAVPTPPKENYWTPDQGQTTTDRVAGALGMIPLNMGMALLGGVTAPGDAYMRGMTQDEMIQRSADLADMLAMGGAGWAAAGPTLGGVGAFGGKLPHHAGPRAAPTTTSSLTTRLSTSSRNTASPVL